MKKSIKNAPMVEPKDFTKHTYHCDGQDFTFAQLCCHFGLKYNIVWWKVVYNGMTVEEAIKACMKNAHYWGVTYSNGKLPAMPEEKQRERKAKQTETRMKTIKEQGRIK